MNCKFITYTNLLNTSKKDNAFLQDCMNEILDYQTARFAYLKKNNELGEYDKDKCDIYRDSKTFTNYKNKISIIMDARYSRAIDIDIKARCKSIMENNKNSLEIKQIKLIELKKDLKKKSKSYKNSYQLHSTIKENINKTRRKTQENNINIVKDLIIKKEKEIAILEDNINNKHYKGIVFGGRDLWEEQFKDGVDYNNWLKKWWNRANEFNCAGAKSENYGNKQFQISLSKDQPSTSKKYFDLQINVPYQLRKQYGDTYIIKNIVFPRGEKRILENVLAHLSFLEKSKRYEKIARKINKTKNKKIIETDLQKHKRERNIARLLKVKPKSSDFNCQAVSILIKKRKSGKMGIHLTIKRKTTKIISHDKNGVIGIDINYNNISMSEIDRKGKLLHSKVFKFNFGNNNNGSYRESLINKHIKTIVDYAKRQEKNIVIEKLDFLKKKAQQLKGLDKNYNRMLHTLAYGKITSQFYVNGFMEGVAISEVNASYTSLLGKTLYCKKLGISVHQAAAYVIARRYYKFLENYESPKIEILYKSKNCQLEMPEDIFKMQNNTKSTAQFLGKLYHWLSCGLKAPKIFLKIETFPSRVNQPTHTSCQSK